MDKRTEGALMRAECFDIQDSELLNGTTSVANARLDAVCCLKSRRKTYAKGSGMFRMLWFTDHEAIQCY